MTRSYPHNDPSKIHPLARLAVDSLPALMILLTAVIVLYGYAGTWPPAVSIISTSMEPNMHVGDEVLIKSLSMTNVHTAYDSFSTHYQIFGNYGDVIVYWPMGKMNVTPVIHRAMYYVEEGQPMWPRGPPAPHGGYITLGDNNGGSYDQLPGSGISPMEPVKKEWVLGVAQYRVPYVGYIGYLRSQISL